jgi:hypothetical protein
MIKRKDLEIGQNVWIDTKDVFFLPDVVEGTVLKLNKKVEKLPIVLEVVLHDNTKYHIKRAPNQLFKDVPER